MTLSYGEIKIWKASDAEKLADGMRDRLRAFEDFEDSLRQAGQWDSWLNSVGATMAGKWFMDFRDRVTDAAAEAQALKNTAERVSSALSLLEQEVISVESYAETQLFSIGPDGGVTDLLAGTPLSPDDKILREARELQIRQTVQEITLKAHEIETIAADGLQAVVLGQIDDGGAGSVDDAVGSQDSPPPPPGRDAPAVEARVWWDSLSPAHRQQMIREQPDDIRNLWGLPADVRDPLNRQALDDEIRAAERTVAELEDRLESHTARGAGSEAHYAGLLTRQAQLDRARHHLATLDNTRDAATGPGRYLLEFDLTEDLPEAAIALGDPDTADHVALSVPGYTTNVHDSIEGQTRNAQHLRAAASQLAPGDSHSTIAFLGYQAPQKTDLLGVGTNSLAVEEAHKVENAVQGIAVANDATDVNVSLFAHSYGSTTSGVAAQNLAADGQSPVDNLAFYGSPGFPEVAPDPAFDREPTPFYLRDLPDPAALGIDDGRAFHMTENGDFVTEMFGEAGTSHVGLGNPPRQWGLEELSMDTTEVVVAVDERGEPMLHDTRYSREDYNRVNGESVGEHSIYTREGTISLHNLAAIAADRPDLVAR